MVNHRLSRDDLLRPVLTEADDATGMDRPWNPWSLVFLVFFAGPLCGGALAAWNFKRLGEPGRFAPAMAVFALTWLGTIVLLGLFGPLEVVVPDELQLEGLRDGGIARRDAIGVGPAGSTNIDHAGLWSQAARMIGLVPAMAVAVLQRRRFRLFEGAKGRAASLWTPGVLAFFVSLVAVRVLVPPLAALVLQLRGAS